MRTSSLEEEDAQPVVEENCEASTSIPRCRNKFGALSFSSTNITSIIFNSQIHGCPPKHINQLPRKFWEKYEIEHVEEVGTLPSNVSKLLELLDKRVVNLQDVNLFACLENTLATLRKDQNETSACFLNCTHGIEVLVEILIRAFYNERDDIFQNLEVKTVLAEDIPAVKLVLQIIFHFSQTCPVGTSYLYDRPHFVHLLFSLLAEVHKKIYTDATLVLEEMILSGPQRPNIVLKKIACLPALLQQTLSHQQEAHLFHVIATAISSSDASPSIDISLQEHDSLLLRNQQNEMNKNNQEYLLNMTAFIDKLFNLTRWKIFSGDRSLLQQFIGMPAAASLSDDQFSMIYYRLLDQDQDNPLYQANLFHEKSIRADVYLLLSLLLTGKCRHQMQENVLKYNLVQRLEQTVDAVVWKSLENEFYDYIHGDYSECGPETTIKIQYLRLIYSISDHHLHRYLILNKEELDEIKEISETHKVPLVKDFDKLDRDKCCKKEQGLLTQIIEKIKLESGSSYIRFWMTRSLESFLRGTTCHVNQIFLVKRGMVEDLFRVLLSDEPTSSEVIQGHFDLLASLMKDSVHAFRRFSVVVDCLHTFQKLCRKIDENLVDSNMFVRCVILTLYYFDSVETEHREFIRKCRILNHYSNFTKRVEAVIDLVGVLTVSTLSQENVSCLNTSIIILLIARINNQLPKYLSAILNLDEDSDTSGRKVLEQLRQLLDFWLEHYTLPFKENDLKSLEESTGFEFSKWKELVQELISSDVTSPNSIMHHISPLTPQYKLQATVAPSCVRIS